MSNSERERAEFKRWALREMLFPDFAVDEKGVIKQYRTRLAWESWQAARFEDDEWGNDEGEVDRYGRL